MSTEKILNFYKEFQNYLAVGNTSYTRVGTTAYRQPRQVVSNNIRAEADGLKIVIDNKQASFLTRRLFSRNFSSDRVLLSIAFMKIDFEEKDQTVYMPLISLDITDRYETLLQAVSTGACELHIDWSSEIVLNELVITSLYDLTLQEAGSSVECGIGSLLEDLVPVAERGSLESVMNRLYEPFLGNEKSSVTLDIKYPRLSGPKSVCFMFFSQKQDLLLKKQRETERMLKKPSELLKRYLLEKNEKNQSIEMRDDTVWLGALTKDYPLGRGQAAAMQQNTLGETLIPVIGGPGTGKTTLFLSLIASEVTKRALKLTSGEKDMSNLMLITSTSNKAVENIYKSLKSGFKHGFCYVGGNNENKERSAEEVVEYIEFLKSREFDEEKWSYHKAKLLNKVAKIEHKRSVFHEIKCMNLEFGDFDSAVKFLKRTPIHVIADNIDIGVLKRVGIERAIEIMRSDNYVYYTKNFLPKSLFTKLKSSIGFSPVTRVLAEFNQEFSLDLDEHEAKRLFSALEGLSEKVLLNILENEKRELVKKALDLVGENGKKFFNGIMKYESFAEYFRTNLFGMNYDIYITSLNFMSQEVLRHKEEVLKAVGYFVADNGYEYILEKYGRTRESQQRFLRFLSMAYPVVTSTLASIEGMFSGLYGVDHIYSTVLADEAGMIAVNDILPALNRSERAIIVGDPKQFEPIVEIHDIFLNELRSKYDEPFWNMYSPRSVSCFHRAAGTVEGGFRSLGRCVILEEHRRCAPKIANLFIDIAEYEGLKVCTHEPRSKKFKSIGDSLFFFNVTDHGREGAAKVNIAEADKIEKILYRLDKIGYDICKEVCIITPYKDQEKYLTDRFGEILCQSKDNVKIGTVHKFQGAEFAVVLFSSVVSAESDSLSFVNASPSMLNVALSRAKEVFIQVGDYNRLTKKVDHQNYVGRVAQHIALNGKLVE